MNYNKLKKSELIYKLKCQVKLNNERALEVDALRSGMSMLSEKLKKSEVKLTEGFIKLKFAEAATDSEKLEKARLMRVISEMAREIYLPEGLK